MYKLATAFAIALVAVGTPVNAQEFPVTKEFVTDAAGVLQPATVAQLEKELAQHKADGKPVVIVVTVPTLGGRTVEAYATGLFNHRGIGDSQKNDGVLLLIAPKERRARITLGRGIDSFQSRERATKIMSTLIDAIKADKMDEGVATATRDLMRQEWVRPAEITGTDALIAVSIVGTLVLVVVIVSNVMTRRDNKQQSQKFLGEIGTALARIRPNLTREGVASGRAESFDSCDRSYQEWLGKCGRGTKWSVARPALYDLRTDVFALERGVNSDIAMLAEAKEKLPQLLAQMPQTLSDVEARIGAAGDTANARRARQKLVQARQYSDEASRTQDVGGLSTLELVALYLIVKNAYSSCTAAESALNPSGGYSGGGSSGAYSDGAGTTGIGDVGGVSDGGGVTGAW